MPPLGSPILIDGSHGEGGGALVRTALAMATLTQQPLRIDSVRGGTKYPGLDYEDLILMRALASSCAAETVGAEVGATSISFLPTRRPRGLNANIDLPEGEARRRGASVPVVLGSLLPVLARAGMYSQVSMSGETYGAKTLSFDYFQGVTVTALRRMGLYAFPEQEQAGFGRESRGVVSMDVEPSELQCVDWSVRGKLISLHAIVTTAELAPAVSQRAVDHLEKLAEHAKLPIEIEANPVDSHTPGAFVSVWACCERGMGGATAMGQRGLRIESLAQSAFDGAAEWIAGNATVDPFLADQLLVTACLAEGETLYRTSRLTERLQTSIWVIKQFLPIHITVRQEERDAALISIRR